MLKPRFFLNEFYRITWIAFFMWIVLRSLTYFPFQFCFCPSKIWMKLFFSMFFSQRKILGNCHIRVSFYSNCKFVVVVSDMNDDKLVGKLPIWICDFFLFIHNSISYFLLVWLLTFGLLKLGFVCCWLILCNIICETNSSVFFFLGEQLLNNIA